MNQLKEIYSLKKDKRLIQLQKEPIDVNDKYILKKEGGLLFATQNWFRAIENDIIPKHIVIGIITAIYKSGHNDFPEFEGQI